MLDDKTLQEVLRLSAGKKLEYDKTKTWVDLFNEQVKAHPTHIAVTAYNGSLSYRELAELSDALAVALMEEEGVEPEEFVAVRLGREKEFYVAVLAIHKAGAAYLPIDLKYPAGRISYMMEDSRARITLTKQSIAKLLQREHGAGERVVCVSKASPDLPAYMIYTSGTSGNPKGVVIPHRALTNFIHFITHELKLNDKSRISLHPNFAFDASVEDLYPALTVGGRVFIAPESARRDIYEMRKFIEDNDIDGGSFPAAFGQLLAMDEELQVDHMLVGGEAMTAIPKVRGRLINVYGPTEFTVTAAFYELEKGREYTSVPIGRPLDNCYAYILDDQLALVEPGREGELCLAGPQLALGYHNRPELTSEKFTTFSPDGKEKIKIYRTGDLARWNEDGQLEFLGRIDTQVKLRGFRIELGEIESCAMLFAGVRQAVAEVKNNTLCLYYTADTTIKEADLRSFMADALTDYMIPGIFIPLANMPVTPNGKIDRKALPEPAFTSGTEYARPRDEKEKAVADAMQRVLGSDDRISVESDFFEMGGDSIKAIRLVSLLRNEGYHTGILDIMQGRSARKIAASLRRSGDRQISQEPFCGEVEDTAIFAFFKDLGFPNPAYFNQSTLLAFEKEADLAALQKASDAICYQHDMLRAVIRNGHLFVRDAAENIPIEEYTVKDVPEDIQKLCESIQSQLDTGRALVRLALIHAGDRDLFFMTAHHTVIDGVSWRIWLDDLERAYGQALGGAPVKLPEKTDTYKDYAEAMKAYRDGASLAKELSFWRARQEKMLSMETSDGKDYGRRFQQVTASMDRAGTERFLTARLGVMKLEVNDLLLTALGEANMDVFGKTDMSVSMEGHGREDLGKGLDTTRTIGWFTSAYPVVLTGFNGDAGSDLIRVKEELRRIPNKGVGYNILAYIGGCGETGLKTNMVPEMIFNYLGDVSGERKEGLYFSPDEKDGFSSGLDYFDEKNHFGSDIQINCLIEDGRFKLWLDYNADRYATEDVGALADGMMKRICALTSFLEENAGQTIMTASDLGENEWSEEEFRKVYDAFAARGETIKRIYPLARMQEEMLYTHIHHPDSFSHRLVGIYKTEYVLGESLLREALDELAAKHETLRTAILYKGLSTPRQAITDRRPSLKIVDLPEHADHLAEAKRIRIELLKTAFDLQDKPLAQFVYVRVGKVFGYLITAMHHIITDGWSIDIVIHDLNALIAGKEIEGSREGLHEEAVRKQLTYNHDRAMAHFEKLLAGYENNAQIPSCGMVPIEERAAENYYDFTVSKETARALKGLCQSCGATLSDGFSLAWAFVLKTASRLDDVAFKITVSGRSGIDMDVSHLVGIMINSAPFRVDLRDDSQGARTLLRNIRIQINETNLYDYCPDSVIEDELKNKVRLDGIYISFENYQEEDDNTACVITPVFLKEEKIEGSKITIDGITQPDGSISVSIDFDPADHRLNEVLRLIRAFEHYVAQMIRNPDLPVARYSHVDDSDREELLALAKGEELAVDLEETWIDSFRRQARSTPEHIAVTDEGGSYTYKELDRLSDAIAHYLADKGIDTESFVALKIKRVKEFVAAAIGVQKAGAAYVPIDPLYPKERIEYMIDDCKAGLVLTEEDILSIERENRTLPGINLAKPEGRAYMIYTSGSTGLPKGVMVPHRALANFIHFIAGKWRLSEKSRIALHSTFAFDASVEDMYPALTAGGRVFIVPESARKDIGEMRRFIEDNGINGGSYSTAFGQLLAMDEELDVDYMVIGGEAMTTVPKVRGRMINAYGPTEFTVDATFFELEKGREYANIPIGRPVDNCCAFILDDKQRLLPRGFIGELCLAGPQLALGYWNRPELTEEKFLEIALSDDKKTRIYRTGDLARWNEEGQLEYCGRIDTQVKLSGYRIELGEVERVAAMYPAVRQTACEVKKGILCLYYASGEPVDEDDLKAFMSGKLAAYMMPGMFICMEQLPVTQGDKIDRARLPEPDRDKRVTEYVPPSNDIEKKLCEVFEEVLELPKNSFGIKDDFYALGGNSIRAMKALLLSRLEGFTIADIVGLRTPEKIAAGLSAPKAENLSEKEDEYRKFALPATIGQISMIDYQFVHVSSLMYNVPRIFSMPDTVSASRLRKAAETAVLNHPALYSVLEIDDNGDIVQRLRPELIHIPEVKEVSEADLADTLASLVRPYRLFSEPLIRVELLRSGGRLYLFIDAHHVVTDGTSSQILLADIELAYQGKPLMKDHYYTWLMAEKMAMGSEAYLKAETYFRNKLGDTDWCSVPVPDYDTEETDSGLETTDTGISLKEMEAAERRHDATGNVLSITAGILALQEYCRKSDILVAWIYSNRTDRLYENTVGMLFRSLPVAVRLEETGSVDLLIAEVKEQVAQGVANSICNYMESIPSSRVLDDDMEINYLAGLEEEEGAPGIPGLEEAELPELTDNVMTGERVGVYIYEEEGELLVTIFYQKKAYAAGSMARFLSIFRKYLRYLVLGDMMQ